MIYRRTKIVLASIVSLSGANFAMAQNTASILGPSECRTAVEFQAFVQKQNLVLKAETDKVKQYQNPDTKKFVYVMKTGGKFCIM